MALVAENLEIIRKDKLILDGVSISVFPGEVTAVIGPNGAGKSTLLSAISGVEQNLTGLVTLDGIDIKRFSPVELAKRRAVMAQENSIVFDFSVEEILLMGWIRDAFGRSPLAMEKIVQIAHSCGITELLPRSFLTLSGGEKQRVQFCRALVQLWRPLEDKTSRYLLLDEPSASLDVAYELSLLKLMVEISRRDTGVLVILHDLNLASYFADSICLVNQGKIEACGKPHEVMEPKLLTDVYRSPIRVERQNDRLYIYTY